MIFVHSTLQPGVEITFLMTCLENGQKSLCYFPNECEISRMLPLFLKSQINPSLSFTFKQLVKVMHVTLFTSY